ncbi:MAG: outer rane efflux protein [Acidobacteria bacterium]|nr:outer rane efflux protein [Acidobacteriota bacterium]
MTHPLSAAGPWLLAAALVGTAGPAPARAQAQAQAQAEPQLPREGGSPLPAPGAGIFQSGQNPLLGGVPSGQATPGTLALSLADAVARGLARNLGIVLGEQARLSAAGGRWQALSGVLPSAALRISQAREEINLQEFGFPVPPGESPIIGPFDVSAVHLGVSLPVFDYAAIQGARAGGAAEAAAGHSFQDVRDLVVYTVSSLYLQAVTASARIDAARAQLATAQALYDRAATMKQAGIVAGIEVLRAQVQLQSQQQRVIFYENERAKARLALVRAIGLPLAQEVQLTDQGSYVPAEAATLESALQLAYQSREDLQAALALVRVAEASRQAAIGTGLPSVRVNADIGRSSNAWDSLLGTYAVTAAVTVPLFQGGRVHGRLLQADAQLQQQRAQVEDLRARIEFEVRSALLDVRAADERVGVARTAADLADEQLVQAQDRFGAGVASNIEVVQAQEALATATENYISALFAHNLAKLSLARATGTAAEWRGVRGGAPSTTGQDGRR